MNTSVYWSPVSVQGMTHRLLSGLTQGPSMFSLSTTTRVKKDRLNGNCTLTPHVSLRSSQ